MDPIRCDYCDELATIYFPRGSAFARSFACRDHEGRARLGAGALPGHGLVDAPLPGRTRFENLDYGAMLERWRQHREAFAR
jgi:hypothetical protein